MTIPAHLWPEIALREEERQREMARWELAFLQIVSLPTTEHPLGLE